MRDLIVDTDVASLLIKRQEPKWVRDALVGNRIWLTFVTVGEPAKWAEIRSWGPRLRTRVEQWCVGRPVIPYDESIANEPGASSPPERSSEVAPAHRTTPGSLRAASSSASDS